MTSPSVSNGADADHSASAPFFTGRIALPCLSILQSLALLYATRKLSDWLLIMSMLAIACTLLMALSRMRTGTGKRDPAYFIGCAAAVAAGVMGTLSMQFASIGPSAASVGYSVTMTFQVIPIAALSIIGGVLFISLRTIRLVRAKKA